MSRIEPDLDKLIWLVAERGDAEAIADFESRFPQHKAELAKRIGMVKGLKLTSASLGTGSMPRFELRPAAAFPTGLAIGAGSVGLALLAGASFWLTSRSIGPKPAPEMPSVATQQPEISAPPATTKQQAPSSIEGDAMPYAPSRMAPQHVPIAAERAPLSVSLAETTLVKAIQAIAAQDGLQVTIAPGFEDRTVSVHLTGKDGFDVLRLLGQEHGFTAFEQGEKSVLIIPAVEGTSTELAEGTGSGGF